ncbi:hypothetical protein [Micromonospora sp. CA-248212]|uniref:hypothetical protein n=1 Tax=Micromonospora sp. CA-248212 TaxID=3239961 RepID=UPI003D92D8BF
MDFFERRVDRTATVDDERRVVWIYTSAVIALIVVPVVLTLGVAALLMSQLGWVSLPLTAAGAAAFAGVNRLRAWFTNRRSRRTQR